MSEGGQQRAFANRIKLQSAQQIRQSATATVKAATEKVRSCTQLGLVNGRSTTNIGRIVRYPY